MVGDWRIFNLLERLSPFTNGFVRMSCKLQIIFYIMIKLLIKFNNNFLSIFFSCSQLGLTKLRVSPAHNRKRLAVESRHHGRPDDSHMFVIKLPPNPYYYGNHKPALTDKNSIDDKSRKVCKCMISSGLKSFSLFFVRSYMRRA